MALRKDQVASPDGGSQCNCTALRKASRRISQLYDTALAPSGVKTTQRAILAQIGRSEPVTVGALAEALVMDSGALAHTLKPLERDGLLAVAVDPADRRNRLISLTQQGRAKLAETDALWTKAQRCFEAALGPAESESLREALRFLISDGFAAAFEDTCPRQPAELRETAMIDLRSDTCSRLTPELRTAMTNAELADDVYYS